MIKDKSIFIKNVYYMLAYAFNILYQLDDKNISIEEFKNIHNMFAEILSKGIVWQLKQGLYREYINKKEDINVMRGKIDILSTLKNKVEKKQRLICEFDDLSENNILNQILKITAMLLLYHEDVDIKYKNNIKKSMLFFSNVDEINPTDIKWSSIRFNRNSQRYRVLIGICQLVIDGMLLTTDHGKYKLASFLNDCSMNRLYEKFILEYYIKEHPELKVSSSHIYWALDDDFNTFLPIMQSDITLENYSGDTVLIIDAKYYTHTLSENNFNTRSIHSSNLYQIFTYVKNKDKNMNNIDHSVSGMLLYAKTDEELQPNNSYKMSGNKISVRTVDLNMEFSYIVKQLDEIVEEHF